ncbi:alpha/beta hydrolase family protein [Yoonia litorea]|uniref:Prolyl oligopeptidase family protein n=1 Tax=Yoonia litorea TaxID=1123755 RepID=A0A1I6LCJ3_9RHOB|nr:alpha/beta fold hydrolase [Yoonia litorea]SFS01163.1 Prolyl oligopeptidase family protein [Yoonia litorea]
MRRALLVFLAISVGLVLLLMAPRAFKDFSRHPLAGPTLDQLEYAEVSFLNGDLRLGGMMFLPDGEGPFPAAVLIRGSGPSRRDHTWYLIIAQELQSKGIAILLPDKRGSEQSGGDWRDTSLEELATDTEAAFRYATQVPAIDPQRIGLLGMSQGGWIAPVAASNNPDVSFVVSMSGAGVTTDEQLLFEEINNIEEIGTYRFVAKLVAPITVRGIKQRDTWRALAGFDPMMYWAKVYAPVFAAFGEGDRSVPVDESVQRFEALPYDITLRIYPDGGHGLTDPDTGRVQQSYLDDLIAFVSSATSQ